MKAIKFILFCLLVAQTGSAQKMELKISTGYHFSSASQYFIDNLNDSYNNIASERVDASLGRGIVLTAGTTYFFKSWLGVSLDALYSRTVPPVKGTRTVNAVDYYYSEENQWNSQTVSLSPSLKIKIAGKKLNPYSTIGFVVPVYSKIKTSGNYSSSSLGGSSKGQTAKILKLKNTIGYTASVGIAPQLTKKLSLIAEIGIISQSVQAKRSTLTSQIVNGVEKIDTYTVYDKGVIYVKKLGSDAYDPGKPRKELGYSLPYSSIGLNAGISIKL